MDSTPQPPSSHGVGPGLTPTGPRLGDAPATRTTPAGRARSEEIPSTRRSVHTPGTAPGSRRATPGTHGRTYHLSASARKQPNPSATPHARAVYRALDSRRAAIFTPGKNRRRSGRDQRETPRDVLRNLSRRLAPTSRQVASSSSPPGGRAAATGDEDAALPVRHGSQHADDDDDDIPIDRPRLSLPIDGDEEDDTDLLPHRSAGLEDENYTMQSVELPRRAISEQPPFRRFSRSSLGSIRISDYLTDTGGGDNDDDGDDEIHVESAFFPEGAFDDIAQQQAGEGDITYERLDYDSTRRETLAAGRESNFGLVDVGNESTFVLGQPSLQAEGEPEPGEEDEEEEEEGEDIDIADATNTMGLRGEEEEEEEADEDTATAQQKAQKRKAKPRRVTKRTSRYGLEHPPLPAAVIKRLVQAFAQGTTGAGGGAKIGPDVLQAFATASDWFLEQVADDLGSFARHAGRKTIEESDVLVLMRRQRQIGSTATPFSLAQRYLPRELLQELRMTAPAPVKARRRRPNAAEDEDGDGT